MKTLFLFFAPLFFFIAGSAPSYAEEKPDVTIESELVSILDSFDDKKGQNPFDTSGLSQVYKASGTLIFFDNSNSIDRKPTIGRRVKTSPSHALRKTLQQARDRFFGIQKNDSAANKSNQPVFADKRKTFASDIIDENASNKKQSINLLKLEGYEGEKTVAPIPPDTVIEVPFLKHLPYFFSRIEILANGSLKVTETIERVVEPKEMNFKGIDRYFSKYYTDRTGVRHRIHLTVLEAAIDTVPVKVKILPDLNGIRIPLYSPTVLNPGTHIFSITYLFPNKIMQFKNNDENVQEPDFKELIWEITGNYWDIPITRAGAVVLFPPNAKIYSQTAMTTGPEGVGDNYRIKKDKNGDLSFALTFPLAPHEGLTALVNWSEPDSNNVPAFENGKLDRFIIEHGTTVVSLISFLFVLSYYLATLFGQKKEKKDAAKASPLQKGDLTPAVLNYALTKKIASKSLFILLLNMAAKGFLSFGEDQSGTVLLIKETDKEKGLTALEKKIAGKLFTKDRTSFAMTHANSLQLMRIMQNLQKTLTKEYKKNFTSFPHTYFWFGVLMAIIAVFSVSSMSLFPEITLLTSLASVLVMIPCAFIGAKIYTEIRTKSWKENKLHFIRLLITSLPLLICLTGLFIYYSIQTTLITALFFFALLICIAIFKALLRAPSALGTSILENIDGYKLYLSSQDDTLLSTMRNAEFKIKALYGKHLPFAVALDLDADWTRRFASFSEKENQLKPDWYKGKLPFTEDFIKNLFTKFDEAFPKKDAAKKSASPRALKSRIPNKR